MSNQSKAKKTMTISQQRRWVDFALVTSGQPDPLQSVFR